MAARKPVTISLDPDLIAQVDRIADYRGETRTAVIERAIRNALPGEERFIGILSNPLARAAFERVVGSPRFMEVIASIVSEDLAPGEAQAMADAVPRLSAAGKRRQAERKATPSRGKASGTSSSSSTKDSDHA